jgi:uncharacterized membrane protein YebE (DUF533 family)
MPRDTLQRALQNPEPLEDRVVDRVRYAVDYLVESETAHAHAGQVTAQSDGSGGRAAEFPDLMSNASVLAAIGACIALGKEEHAARRAALTLDLYSLGLPESRRSRIIAHAAHPQRPIWLASGVRDRRLTLWMYATCRTLVENTARGRVFVEDVAEALRIPVKEIRVLKQKLPLLAPGG